MTYPGLPPTPDPSEGESPSTMATHNGALIKMSEHMYPETHTTGRLCEVQVSQD